MSEIECVEKSIKRVTGETKPILGKVKLTLDLGGSAFEETLWGQTLLKTAYWG